MNFLYSVKDVTAGFGIQDTARGYEYLEMPSHQFTFWYFDGVNHIPRDFCNNCWEHNEINVTPVFRP